MPKFTAVLSVLVVLFSAASRADEPNRKIVPPREGKSETIQLFNGKDLDGWRGT